MRSQMNIQINTQAMLNLLPSMFTISFSFNSHLQLIGLLTFWRFVQQKICSSITELCKTWGKSCSVSKLLHRNIPKPNNYFLPSSNS